MAIRCSTSLQSSPWERFRYFKVTERRWSRAAGEIPSLERPITTVCGRWTKESCPLVTYVTGANHAAVLRCVGIYIPA
jgi:hypothetical protein